MGHLGQTEIRAEVGQIGEELGDAAVIGLEERLEGQHREQLMRGEVLATAGGGVRRKGLLGQLQCLAGQSLRGLGHGG